MIQNDGGDDRDLDFERLEYYWPYTSAQYKLRCILLGAGAVLMQNRWWLIIMAFVVVVMLVLADQIGGATGDVLLVSAGATMGITFVLWLVKPFISR